MASYTIISPHLDDAALSCWHRVEVPGTQVVTVFTGAPAEPHQLSAWDVATGFSSPQAAIAARQRENIAALRHTPSEIINLGHVEHVYSRDPPAIDRVVAELLQVADREAIFIAAAGLSHLWRPPHPDHRTVRAVGQQLRQLGRSVLFFADIPYVLPRFKLGDWPANLSPKQLRRRLGIDVIIEPVELSRAQQRRKRQALRAYRSQIPVLRRSFNGALDKRQAYRWEAILRPV